MYRKITNSVVVVVICIGCAITNGQRVLNPSAKSISEGLPPRVVHLFNYWPDTAALSEPNRVSGNENQYTRLAKEGSVASIAKVLNPVWLPTEKGYLADNLIMIADEFEKFDVTHVQWIKNRYNIKVSQTAGIIMVKLTPMEAIHTGTTKEEKVDFAKTLCRQLVNDTGMRYGLRFSVNNKGEQIKTPVKVTVTGLSGKICSYSFRPELCRQFPDGVIGEAAREEDEGLAPAPRDGENVNYENREDNLDWDKSRYSWGYWWRHVCWWNDGKSVGFFTLNTEGGAWSANYWDNYGTRWFEGEEFVPVIKKK